MKWSSLFRGFVLMLCLMLAGIGHAAEPATPQFSDYRVSTRHVGTVAPLRLQTRQDRLYRTAIREAHDTEKVNFAGHYILSVIGCGSSCLLVFALDADTGRVHWLPFSVSWGLEDKGVGDQYPPLDFRIDSRLLVVAGSRNEHGHGLYYYVFDGNGFRLLRAREDPPNGMWD